MNNPNNQNEQWKLLVLLLKEIAESKGITQNEINEKTEMRRDFSQSASFERMCNATEKHLMYN